jgi:hypothetical protein
LGIHGEEALNSGVVGRQRSEYQGCAAGGDMADAPTLMLINNPGRRVRIEMLILTSIFWRPASGTELRSYWPTAMMTALDMHGVFDFGC